MDVAGEAITTPFTFVATTHALYWNKIRPVFADIEPDYFTLDPEKVESLITPWTTAILAVHVFGHPCRLDRLAEIAKKHNLKLIYDAAHAFGVRVDDQPITDFGDISLLSFHATKLFHSIEGGALVFKESGLRDRFNYLKNFGFKSDVEVVMPGTNAKMNEFQALMGMQVLQYMDRIIQKRKEIHAIYRERIKDIPDLDMCPEPPDSVLHNYAYVPVLVDADSFGLSRDNLANRLKEYNVIVRKYFYPMIPEYACYRNIRVSEPLTTAKDVSMRILTLPIYYELSFDDVHRICDMIEYIHHHPRKPEST
jgi:dTDP-4-amino-4,6-dideoxygalactose transaminase